MCRLRSLEHVEVLIVSKCSCLSSIYVCNIYIFFILDLEFTAREGEWFVPNGGRIHREDVARYLLKTAKEHLHSSKIVAIATKQQ